MSDAMPASNTPRPPWQPPSHERFLNELVFSLYGTRLNGNATQPRIGNMVAFNDPADVDHIVKDHATFRKNFSLISAIGFSRFNTNDEEWAARRKITQDHYLEAARPARQADVFRVYADALAPCEPSWTGIQQALFVASLTIFHGAFGVPVHIRATVAVLDRIRDLLRRLQYFSWSAPTPFEHAAALSDARAIVADFESQLGRNPKTAALMEHFSKAADGVDAFRPAEEFVMNLFAGVETTVATTQWVIDRLSANPEVQQRVLDEILSAPSETPYTDCLINETMRYFPAIPFLIREVGSQTRVGKTSLNAGQLILLSIVGVHHHAGYWQSPDVFDSRRPEFLDNTYDRRAFIPFISGARMCGGARLARLEVKEAVRAFVPLFAVSRNSDKIVFDYALALRPASEAFVVVNRR